MVEPPALPAEFVYLEKVAPTIIQSPRYATADNIVGRALTGYQRPTIIVTTRAAEQLKRVQETVERNGFCLVVYDGYRPQSAVDDLVAWTCDSDLHTKQQYYPRIASKHALLTLHYLAKKSAHSRGSTVDLTLIEKGKCAHEPHAEQRTLTDGTPFLFLDDGTIDMGTAFDFMDEASHHGSTLVPPQALALRSYLKQVMEQHGFRACKTEWWHYTLCDEPFLETPFSFPVQ